MITYNKKDFNLTKILEETKLLQLKCVPNYYIIGTKDIKDNRCIKMSYSYNTFPKLYDFCYYLQLFFNNNGLSSKFTTEEVTLNEQGFFDNTIVKIGLRKDLRKNINLSARILETMIFAYENKIKFGRCESKRKFDLPAFRY